MGTFKNRKNFSGKEFDASAHGGKRFGGSSSRKFDGPKKFKKHSDGPKTFGEKESRSGNGFKLHEAVCDKCGNTCDLPFKPTGNKPIYCRSCFRENKKFPEDFQSRSSGHTEQPMSADALERINRKLDKIMKALKIE